MFSPLPRTFFQRSAVDVAPSLLGKTLLIENDQGRIAGIINECEAYQGERDLACHARSGKTARTMPMYGEAGHAYVYFTYGMHWMLNVVTDAMDEPAAVLIRSILPTLGKELIARRRHPQPEKSWTNGPAKVCRALYIDIQYNNQDFCDPSSPLRICEGVSVSSSDILQSPRIGIDSVPEPWLSKPWRFYLADDSPCLTDLI